MDLTNKRIVVVGGAGLIGSHLVDQLVAEPVRQVTVLDNFVRGSKDNLRRASRSAKVEVVEASITDLRAVRRVIEGADGVFLLASLWLGECLSDPRAAWDVNVLGTWNVVEACRDLGVQRIVFSSSASVYGNAVVTPMTEEHPFANRSTYGATKIANEQMLRAVYEQSRLPYVGLRYMNVYGPRMDRRGAYVSVIMKVLDRIMAGERPVIHGDGTQTFDFVYVEDVARANLAAMRAECADELFNVGTGVGTTIRDVVGTLIELSGANVEPEYERGATMFVSHRVGSTEKAERLLAFRATTDLRAGLEEVVEWRRALA
jgi:UDP-glucose 4-epimerase